MPVFAQPSANPGLSATVRWLGLAVFLFDCMFGYAIYLAWFSLNGLSILQIGVLLAIWSGSALLLEVVTGALSDRYNRRDILIAAPLIKSLTFVLWGLNGDSMVVVAAGFIAWTLGESLYSGTREALLYEHLQRAGLATAYDRHYGRLRALQSLGVGSGLALGGFIAAFSMQAALWWSVPPLLLCAFVASRIDDARETDNTTSTATANGLFWHIRNALQDFRANPVLRPLTLYIAAGLCLLEELEEFDQLFYLAVALPVALFGVAGAAGLALDAAASALADRLPARRHLAWLLPLAGALLLFIAAQGESPWIIIVLELSYIVVAPAAILAEARYQHHIDGRSRATATSLLVFLQNIVAMLLALAIGAAAHWLGVMTAYTLAGAYLLAVALLSALMVIGRRTRLT